MPNSQKGFAPIIIILGIVLILGIVGGVFFGKAAYLKLNCPFGIVVNNECGWNWAPPPSSWQPTSSSTPTATPKVDETTNWKTYTNTKYGFAVNYPPEWKLNSGDNIVFSIYETTPANARIELFKDFMGGFCEGSTDTKDVNIVFDSMNANKVECSSTIAINFPKNGNNFWLIATFVNDKNRDTFNQILSTFKFLDSNTGSGVYTCPSNGYQNCMPVLDAESQQQCSKEALDWKKANCPNFTGAAY